MTDVQSPPQTGNGGRHRRGKRRLWLRLLLWTSGALVFVLVAAALMGFFTYRHYDARIHRIPHVLKPSDPHIVEPTRQLNADNFLLIGSDTREGKDAGYESSTGQVVGARSDTTILAHLSPDGGKATLVSFPRDSWVHVPACAEAGGKIHPPYTGMFNSAYALGGPACTVALVQALTGIEVTHYAEVDFVGFRNMVSALDGVPVCSPTAVYDSESGLRLHKGEQVITGAQALAYVRARYGLGNGSDLGRIKRQQQFLASIVRVATSSKTLFDPGKLKKFLDAATASLTLDSGTHLKDLYSLAKTLEHLDPAHTNFYTAPIANPDYTPPGYVDGGRVLLDTAKGKLLWTQIIDDSASVTVVGSGSSARTVTPTATTPPAATSSPTGAPAPNGSGKPSASGRPTRSALVAAPTPNFNAATHNCTL
ncbi:MAG: LCP family protein [Mycobacteriales bacterium]